MARSATRRAPVRDRPPWLCSALGSGQSLACSCPLQCVWRRTPWCAGLLAHPNHADHVQRSVGVPVATAVEAMPDNLAGGCLNRRDTAEAGEGGFALHSLSGLSSTTLSSVAA